MNERKLDPKPGRAECIRAKCFDCTAQFGDGRVDCQNRICPLYSRMPYHKGTPRIGWLITGKWSKKYQNKLAETGLTLVEYATQHLMRNNKLRLRLSDMMRAKCFSCCADYTQSGSERGRVDCENVGCPLYRYTPYRQLRPDYSWLFEYDHTNVHRDYILLNGITREEYIDMKFGMTLEENEEDEETDDDSDDEIE